MKKILERFVSWMTVLGNICVLMGCFVTFAKGYGYWDYEETYSVALFRVFGYEQYDSIKVMVVIMWIAAIVSLFALSSFKEYTGVAASITLVVAAFVGNICFGVAKREIFSLFNDEFAGIEKYIGCSMIEKAYIAIIIAAFLALGTDMYRIYIKESLKEKIETIIVPSSSLSCPQCGKTIVEGSKYCAECGFAMEMLVCPKCGSKREKDASFCNKCGEKLLSLPEFKD